MRKWKLTCPSRQKTENKQSTLLHYKIFLQNEAGITLVELLAALAIMSLVFLLVGAIHIFGQQQFRSQSESAHQANDLSYALTAMTSDLRRHAFNQVEVTENTITVQNGDGSTSTYSLTNGKLMHDDVVLIDNVSRFNAEKSSDEKVLNLSLGISSNEPGVMDKDYETSIYFRAEAVGGEGGDPFETDETGETVETTG